MLVFHAFGIIWSIIIILNAKTTIFKWKRYTQVNSKFSLGNCLKLGFRRLMISEDNIEKML